jgi:hypothetical protein
MKTIKTIDVTPTVEEATRIYAYVLCNVSSLPMVLKDYWEPTEDEGKRIRDAYNLYDEFIKLAAKANMIVTNVDKRKWSRAALKQHGFTK